MPAIVLALADDQADEAPAIVLALADDQADILPPRDELVCGAEVHGPAGAFVVVGGAAYVPSEAEPWYTAICAAIAPLPGEQADNQAARERAGRAGCGGGAALALAGGATG